MPERDDLLDDLRELGRSVPAPGADALAAAVLARLAGEADAPVRHTGRALRVAAVALATLLALLLVPPVRAAVSDWFGFGSVIVRDDDGSGPPAPTSPTPAGPGRSAREAASLVDFATYSLPALGDPERAWVSPDRRVLTFTWADGTRLDQSSSLSYTFAKSARVYETVPVDGTDALWFGDSHDVAVVDERGREVVETRRRAGSTLVFILGDTTLRLEGERSLTSATTLAESARPLG